MDSLIPSVRTYSDFSPPYPVHHMELYSMHDQLEHAYLSPITATNTSRLHLLLNSLHHIVLYYKGIS